MSPNENSPENSPEGSEKSRLDKRRFWSRVVAASLLIGGVGVAIIDIMATRAHSQSASPTAAQAPTKRQTTAASSASASRTATNGSVATNTATSKPAVTNATAVKPVNPAQLQAVRNPSQINTQPNPNSAVVPVASDQSSDSVSSVPPKTRTTLKPILKTTLSPAAVDWSQAVTVNRRTLTNKTAQINSVAARLPKLQLDKTRLPVLLPKAGTTLKATEASMVSFGNAYSLSLPQKPGVNIILYGHRSLVQADKGGVSSLKRSKIAGVAEDIFLSQTEDGWTASFKRYGVVYTVDVSCDDLEAAECKDDGYIRKAIADMGEVSLGTEALKEAALAGVKP